MSTDDAPAEQTEFNLGNSTAMNEAVAAAVRATSVPGQAPPSAETIAAARVRAQQMLNEMKGGDADGIRDLKNLTLSMGLPSTRALFRQMITASGVRGQVKSDAQREVAEFSPVTEVGCMKVDFFNKTTGRADIAYLLLDQCPKTHNLGDQLDRLKVHVSDEKWPEVLRHLSMLVHIGRSVFGQTARQHLDLIRRLFGLAPDADCAKYIDVQIARENTTFFIDADWPNRVGLYVRLDAEVQAENAAAAAAAAAK